MNELYAIEPTAFDDHKDLNYLLSKFGFYEGRFIAEYPGNWLKRVYLHLNNLPDIERTRATVLLKRFKEDRIIPSGLAWVENNDWIQNATLLKQDKKITDVIVARDHAGVFQSPDDVDESYFYKHGSGRQSKVMSNAEGYANAASMLLRLSHEVAIIDPYFFRSKSKDGLKKVIQKFADIAITGKCRRFIIYTLDDSNSATDLMVKNWMQANFCDVYKKGISISLYILQDIDHKDADDHARYLVSTKGAMSFDKGFIEEYIPRLRSVGVLDQPMHDSLRKQYLENEDALPFKIKQRCHLGVKPLLNSM